MEWISACNFYIKALKGISESQEIIATIEMHCVHYLIYIIKTFNGFCASTKFSIKNNNICIKTFEWVGLTLIRCH